MSNYIKDLRAFVGQRKFIHPACRIIIENEEGKILLIKRRDNGQWGLPAGGLEEGENIEACIRREVKEETGLELTKLEVIGISSHPKQESVVYPNGDEIQYFVVEFYANQWSGVLLRESDEASTIQFLPVDVAENLPTQEWSTFESLVYFRTMGRMRLR